MKGYRLKRQPKKLPTVANIRPLRVVNYGASFFSAPIYGRRASRLGLVSIMRNALTWCQICNRFVFAVNENNFLKV